MQVKYINYPIKKEEYKSSIIAIGSFDGVHLGHQRVIKKAVERARQRQVLSGVMVFEPHPQEVLELHTVVEKITPIASKINQIELLGVDICYVANFTKQFANITPKEFIDDFLVRLDIKGIVVGYDFTFGYKGAGDTTTLYEYCKDRYSVDVIEPYYISNEKISSTKIRDYLKKGNIIDANKLLGRRHSFKGKVVYGDGRGKDIGFPTVNLELLEKYIMIKKGVYSVYINYYGNKYKGVMNVGHKPTFNDKSNIITYEIHIIDFNKDIYDEILEVELVDFIREEKKYNSVKELKNQIINDILKAEQIELKY